MLVTPILRMPIDRWFDLNEDQRSLVLHCLQMAAQKFHENTRIDGVEHILSETFADQRDRTKELIGRLENARYIRVGPVEN